MLNHFTHPANFLPHAAAVAILYDCFAYNIISDTSLSIFEYIIFLITLKNNISLFFLLKYYNINIEYKT
jgi:hypothetical protein